ncbi:MAG TPA: 2-dehydropantoate 2-reductase [Thermoanaerobaculia bacterium]|nr:2-dehydropantoate 2-reductase [Thermoanaerobaculia bacterium]
MSAYRIAVVGAGGVGGYFGGKLAAAGVDTTFVVRGRTLEALRSRGLRVQSVDGDFSVDRVNATDRPTGAVDAVLMTVKAWQIPEAAAQIKPVVGDETIVVPLENGIDAPEQLATVLDRRNVAGGLCTIVSFVVEPGVIRHAGGSPFIMFGELDNRTTARAQRLVGALRSAGLKADIAEDIHKSMWSKFVFIAPMSGIGAATRLPVGAWRSVPETRALAERAIGEVIAVANARGIRLDDDMVEKTMQRFDGLPPDATASLQRDVMSGKPSELDAQLGAAVRLARECGVATPVLETLYAALVPQERAARGD